jgi:glycosyltransferase involved in cell wall biosynthesis
MKILIVRTFPNIIDPEKYNVQEIGLAKALTRTGHQCDIVLYYGKNKDKTEFIPVDTPRGEKKITIYRLHGYNFLKNGIFPSLSKITGLYDVIQVHEYDQITSWLYYAWTKKPVVIYHGPYYHPFNKGYNLKCKVFDHTFLSWKRNRNVPCLTKSHGAEEFLRKKGFANVRAVGVGLDSDNLKTGALAENSRIAVDVNCFTLLYVGKIEERRNPYFLLELIEAACREKEDIRCIVVGNGEKAYLEAWLNKARPMIDSGKLHFYKQATQAQLADLYQRVQLMLFPTHYDIFGMVLLEALYFGLPVISSRNGGADMTLADCDNGNAAGVILEDFAKESWMSAIKTYYERWKDAGESPVSRTDKTPSGINISWDDLAEDFLRGYEAAIAEKTGGKEGQQ